VVLPETANYSYESSAEIEIEPSAKPQRISIDPFQLIGPIEPLSAETQAATAEPASLAHQPAYPGEKWIEVNVTSQQVTAWEGDKPVMSFTVSTGLPDTPTVLGKFNVYWKLTSTLMVGDNYYLPEVPYTMYFYAGYALHGTYWHKNFGQPMSHGCVNLETSQAKKLFDWADPILPPGQTEIVSSAGNPGTLVVVHE
jgi:lipoprotein-anchoring transpeptidase ErfK/SrfK